MPGLGIGVRLSVIDSVPYRKTADGPGEPETNADGYRHGFGVVENADLDRAVLDRSLTEGREFLRVLQSRGIRWVCLTAGSPYYCPHVVRPALFPPADGYEPPEDPLRGVARQIRVTATLKSEFPDMVFVGSAYTYLQEWLPNVGQYTLRHGMTDFVGLGRMMLSYPDLAADVLEGRPLTRKLVCRTFSDCTTGPRLGLVSGCYPLDPLYVAHPHAATLKEAKAPASKDNESARPDMNRHPDERSRQIVAVLTAFLSLFAVVGFALYGLPRFYPYFVQELGWTRQQVTSGNAYSKIFVALAFGFLAGRLVDRFGPRRLHARRHRHGRRRARRPLVCDEPQRVLFLLHLQRARLRVRRAAAEPGAALALVRQGPRQGDGHRLSRHRRRRRARAAPRVRADAGVRLARRACASSAC